MIPYYTSKQDRYDDEHLISDSLDNFDLERIDERLRTLGIDPELIELTDDECESIRKLSSLKLLRI